MALFDFPLGECVQKSGSILDMLPALPSIKSWSFVIVSGSGLVRL